MKKINVLENPPKGLMLKRTSKGKPKRVIAKMDSMDVFSLILLPFVFGLLFLLYLKYSSQSLEYFINLLSIPLGKTIGTLIIMGIGYLLFVFKKKQQFWYGISETSFALTSCYTAFNIIEERLLKSNIELASFATICTTIYLVVRGLSNISDGYKNKFFLKNNLFQIYWWKGKGDSILLIARIASTVPMFLLLLIPSRDWEKFMTIYYVISLIIGEAILFIVILYRNSTNNPSIPELPPPTRPLDNFS